MIGAPVFCLQCGSSCCLHLQKSRRNILTPREVSILRDMVDPHYGPSKEMAFHLGISPATIKVYLVRIYEKLGWIGGSQRLLTLWALAHREQLGLDLPTPDQFPAVTGEVAA